MQKYWRGQGVKFTNYILRRKGEGAKEKVQVA